MKNTKKSTFNEICEIEKLNYKVFKRVKNLNLNDLVTKTKKDLLKTIRNQSDRIDRNLSNLRLNIAGHLPKHVWDKITEESQSKMIQEMKKKYGVKD